MPGWRVCGWAHRHPTRTIEGVEWLQVDIEDPHAVRGAIVSYEPTHIVHLAAASNVAGSFSNPRRAWSVNVMGTLHLINALHDRFSASKLVLVSSSEVYGQSFDSGKPLAEDAPLKPKNPYAASKAAAELLASTYTHASFKVLCARPFNHIGAGQDERFAISSFAHQLARIKAGRQSPVLHVGNLDTKRDFLDVRDVVNAYVSMLEQVDELPSGLTLNFCSGTTRKVGDVLAELIAQSGLEIQTVADPKRMRPSDTPIALGTSALARQYLGWSPKIPFAETLRWIMDDARASTPS